ncbi:MAG: adenosine deaminase [Gemmatimonadales bacterium]|nr:adenosine deaminase [Gemmatimonadales bacterium]
MLTETNARPTVPLEVFQALPKTDLHVHLDGSLRPATLVDLAQRAGVPLPTTDPAALARHMLVDDAAHLDDYLARFELTIAVLQDAEALERVAYEMVEDAAQDGVSRLEVRNCPLLNTRRGLTLDEAIVAQCRGLARGAEAFGVSTGLINCSLRHYDPADSVRIAEASVRHRDAGVVAFDLAGGEAGRPPGPHGPAFDVAREGMLGITVHAGEAAGPDSIREALFRCHAMRLGHGTRLIEDPALLAYVRDRQVPIEINLTSNVQTRAVRSLAEHPLRRYLDEGLAVTLCTDNWLMSGVSLTDEYEAAQAALGLGDDEVVLLMRHGLAASFAPWPERQRLLEASDAALAAA